MKGFIGNRWVWLTSRLLLGALLMVTGIPKIADINGFVDLVIGYGILPTGLATLFGSALPWVELYIGCALILGVFVRLTTAVVIPMSLSFGFAGIYAMLFGSGIICGCFGTAIQISHPVSLTIDAIMLLLAIGIVTQEDKDFLVLGQVIDRIAPDFRIRRRAVFNMTIVAAVLLAMAIITGITFLMK